MAFDIKRIEKSVRIIKKFVKKDPKRPGVDSIHDLRTNSRRLETALKALGPSSSGEEKSLLKHLARLRKRAGKMRDMDVLIGETLTIKDSGEQNCVVQLLEYLGAERGKHAKKEHALVEKLAPRIRRELERVSKRGERLFERAEDQNSLSEKAEREVRAKITKLSSDLRRPARLNRSNLHPYRLKLKKLLYVLQLFPQASDHKFAEKVAKANDAIGKWHDWDELRIIAEQVIDHGPECRFLQRLKTTCNSKYDQALFVAHQLREQCLVARQGKMAVNS